MVWCYLCWGCQHPAMLLVLPLDCCQGYFGGYQSAGEHVGWGTWYQQVLGWSPVVVGGWYMGGTVAVLQTARYVLEGRCLRRSARGCCVNKSRWSVHATLVIAGVPASRLRVGNVTHLLFCSDRSLLNIPAAPAHALRFIKQKLCINPRGFSNGNFCAVSQRDCLLFCV